MATENLCRYFIEIKHMIRAYIIYKCVDCGKFLSQSQYCSTSGCKCGSNQAKSYIRYKECRIIDNFIKLYKKNYWYQYEQKFFY